MSNQPLPNRWVIMQIVNLGTFMTTLDVGIVNLALPTMAYEFTTTLSYVQWVVTAYLLSMVALLPILGKLSDRLDRRQIYSWGFFVFGIGSLLAAVATSLTTVIIARCVQGIGSAMVMANSQAMVRAIFPDHERGKALGTNTIVMSIGTLSGPAVGGFLMELGGWPLLFWINVPLGVVGLYLGLRMFPQTERSAQPLDVFGSLLLALATSLLLYASVVTEQAGFTSTVIWMGTIGLLLIVVLLLYERKLEHGILDRVLYANPYIGIGNLSAFLFYAAQMASLIPITFYMQSVLQLSTQTTGLLLAIQPVFMGVMGPISGWCRDRYGARIPTTIGALLCTFAMLPVMIGNEVSMLDIIAYCSLFGLGTGLFLASNNADIMGNAPAAKASLVGSMLALIRYLGMIVGIALAVLLVGHLGGVAVDAAELAPKVRVLFSICALFALILTGFSLMRPRKRSVPVKAT
ncbi:MFS transporter [Paenibacillus koleovorans]|uniref:MFS transporter n=1 Tax=Paenibacillus koleovorans TaxID=121608 RepID=UPI000FD6F717|nr:MFS transporter [Paenibacillus koleovorans]